MNTLDYSELDTESVAQLAELRAHFEKTDGIPPLSRKIAQSGGPDSICKATIFLAQQAINSPIYRLGQLDSQEVGQKVRTSIENLEDIDFHANFANLGNDELQIRFFGALRKIAETDVDKAHKIAQRILD